nr:hypothetical protein [Burkholderia multivorans]
MNNVALRSWYGIGFAPTIDGMPVPRTEFSHWFDTRTGNAGFRGTLDVGGLITAQTPPSGDASRHVPTTEWVVAAIASASIGTIVFEPRTSVRAGFLKLNGALVKRSDYPALWAYAQASGALVAESAWAQKQLGLLLDRRRRDDVSGYPSCAANSCAAGTTAAARILRAGIGTFQSFQNAWHAHGHRRQPSATIRTAPGRTRKAGMATTLDGRRWRTQSQQRDLQPPASAALRWVADRFRPGR